MTILQVGAAKSGNFWLYRITQAILKAGGREQTSFIQDHPIFPLAQTWPLSNEDQAGLDFIDIIPAGCFFRISSIFRYPIDDLQTYLHKASLVRSHSRISSRTKDYFGEFDRIVYIIRDPRDVAVSFSRFAFTPYYQRFYPHSTQDSDEYLRRNFERRLWGWSHHVIGYLQHRDVLPIHFTFFEGLKLDFQNEVTRLAAFLDVELSTSQIEQIRELTSVESMQASNPDHVRKGTAGGWAETLSDAMKRRARFSTAPILRYLGYPSAEAAVNPFSSSLPRIPSTVNSAHLNRMLQLCRMRIALSALLSGNFNLASMLSSL